MRIGVVSDTHLSRHARGLPQPLVEGLTGVVGIFHLGDFIDPEVPALFEAIAPLEAVAGNNDGPEIQARYGRRKVVTVGGLTIGLVHGDAHIAPARKYVRQAFSDVEIALDVVCYGHSHIPECVQENGVWYVNPGSPTDKRRMKRFSYAILTLEGGIVTPVIHEFG